MVGAGSGGGVTCGTCGARVPQAESYFAPNGALACARCHAAHEAGAQVARGNAAIADEMLTGQGLLGAAMVAVDQHLTSELANTPSPAQPRGPTTTCANCGAVVESTAIEYARDGSSMCGECARTYDPTEDERRLGGKLWAGLLLGFCLGVVGVGLAFALGRPYGEKRAAMMGAAVNAVIALVILRALAAM